MFDQLPTLGKCRSLLALCCCRLAGLVPYKRLAAGKALPQHSAESKVDQSKQKIIHASPIEAMSRTTCQSSQTYGTTSPATYHQKQESPGLRCICSAHKHVQVNTTFVCKYTCTTSITPVCVTFQVIETRCNCTPVMLLLIPCRSANPGRCTPDDGSGTQLLHGAQRQCCLLYLAWTAK